LVHLAINTASVVRGGLQRFNATPNLVQAQQLLFIKKRGIATPERPEPGRPAQFIGNFQPRECVG
jgi:hypothetical protein